MSDRTALQEFLDSIQQRIVAPPRKPTPHVELLEEALEELQVAVEELRVAEEEIASASQGAHSEQRLRERDLGRAQAVFFTAPMAMLLSDRSGLILDANTAAAALLGVPVDKLAGKPLAVFVAPDARLSFRAALNRLTRGDTVSQLALVLTPRGRLPLDAELTAWGAGSGADLALCWELRDVTGHRAREEERDEAAGILRSTLDSLPVAATALDHDGSVLLWNAEARRLLGWSEEELAGMPGTVFPDELTPILDAVRRAGTSPRLTLEVISTAELSGGGQLPVRVTVGPLADQAGEAQGTVALFAPLAEPGAPGTAADVQRRSWSAAELRRVLFEGARGDVAERMRAGIASALDLGYLRPGDRLPGAREAAAASGADHRIVSSAYRWLAAEGLVEVRPRRGAQIALPAPSEVAELGETAEWLAGVLEGAAQHQVRVGALPELVRRWTATVPVRCLCVEATEDGRQALAHEMTAQWGMECLAVSGEGRGAQRELAAEVRAADLVVTTHFAAGALRPLVRHAGRALVVAGINPELVDAMEEALRRGPLTAVVADPAYGERLRAVAGGERLRVLHAGERTALESLDPAQALLLTLAAQQKLTAQPRLLWAPAHFLAPLDPRVVARVLLKANLARSERA